MHPQAATKRNRYGAGVIALALICGMLLLCFSVPASPATPSKGTDTNEVMKVTIWAGKNGRGLYEVALLRAILDRTKEHYPSYQLTVNSDHLGTQRGRQVVADGHLANVYVSGLRQDDYIHNKRILLINKPTMNGLLGYRAAVIRQTDTERYAQSAAQHKLRDLTIGQGNSWSDVGILRHNHFTVNDSGRYENLFEMLAYGRFDAIFFGLAEIQQELAASKLQEQLTIAYQPIIYYPHAMVFQVSGNNPQLAKRIEEGLQILSADGSHEQLLEHYFGSTIKRIRDEHTRIIVLAHPIPTLIPELAQPVLAQQE